MRLDMEQGECVKEIGACVGKGKGANVAPWRQCAVAELAATMGFTVAYALALLDLVKAFERILRWLLVREALVL